jgi:hypothetical protein
LDQSEVEKLVEELELRVERLRSLYDQYFMGIEKIEPAVPRKDVERRLYVLRRTQIRNTGLRFRFHNALLRYNTYQTYWMRICRQIEEGTYKRDVRRANARFAQPRRGAEERKPEAQEVHDTERPPPGGIPEDLAEDVDMEFEPSDDLPREGEDWLEEMQMRAILRPAGASNPLEIPTQREFFVPPPPSGEAPPTTRKSVRPAATQKAPAAPRPAGPPPLPGAARVPAPAAPSAPISATSLGGGRYVQAGKARPASQAPVQARPPPAARPLPPPAAPPPVGARPPSGGPPKKKSRPPTANAEAPNSPRVGPPPAPPRPQPRAAPAVPPPRPKEGHLSEERVRQIYTQYVDTKRSLKESTASITYESLSRSLQDSTEKLRQKHNGRSVDFEVTVKDGRTILRPVVK